MPGEMGEQSKGFEVPDYSKKDSSELIEIAQGLTTKADIGRLNVTLLARLADPSRDDRDMTLAALQALTAQEAKLLEAPARKDDMLFEGTNSRITEYSTEESLPQEEVDRVIREMEMHLRGKTKS
jgi:hypothetical protein